MRSLGILAIALAGLPVLSTSAVSQELRGRITGVVTDDSSAVVPGVTITATSAAVRRARITTSDAHGGYDLPALPPGLYTLTFELWGFTTIRREDVRVTPDRPASINAQLRPASLSETLTVSGRDNSYAPMRAVVAGKSAAPLTEIPQSVSVVTQVQIHDRNLFTIGEAVHTVAGVTVMPFNGINPDYRARGFVLDYAYDGVPSMFSSGVPEFDLVIYERLEVQRGPTGLFRGSGSPGGTIHLNRKRGQGGLRISGALSAGAWDNYRAEFDLGGPLDRAGRLRARIVAALHDRDFFQAKSHTRKVTAMSTVDFDLASTTTVGASVSYQDTTARTPMNGQPAFSDERFLGLARDFQHLPHWNLFTESIIEHAAEVTHRIGKWSLVARPVHRNIPRAAEDAFIMPNTGVDPTTLSAQYVSRRSKGENGKTAVDAYAVGPFTLFGRRHELAAGYSFSQHTTSFLSRPFAPVGRFSIFNADAIPVTPSDYAAGSDTDMRQSGFYSQLRLRPVQRVTLVLGARVGEHTNRSRNSAPSVPTDFRVTVRERGRVTPSVGAVLHLTSNATLYGSYSEIFNPQASQRSDGTLLEPRIGGQHEAGLKGRFRGGALNASVALFRSRDKNRALADTAAPGFFVPAGVVSIRGFEFEVSGTPMRGLDLTASYTNVTTEYEVGAAAQTGAVFDIFTPRDQHKFYARYEPTVWRGAFVAASVNGQSRVLGGGVAGIREQGAFAVAGVQAGWRLSEGLRVFVSVNNVFDTVYYERVGSINTSNVYGEPRHVLLTLRANY